MGSLTPALPLLCTPAHRQLLKTELGSFFTEYLQVGAVCSPEGLLPELAGGRGRRLPVGTWSSGFKVSAVARDTVK